MLAITERKKEVSKSKPTPPSCCQYRVRQQVKDIIIMDKREDRIQLIDDEVTQADYQIAEIMAKVAMYNITGQGEEPSEFEKRLANREFENLLNNF